MSKKENPEKKPIFQKAVAMAKQKEAEKKSSKGKEKESVWKRIVRFFKDIRSETKKIVWPSKKQVFNNTVVVLVVMALSSVVIWPLDWLLLKLFGLMF